MESGISTLEKIKFAAAGALGGAIVLASVGFGWGGWLLPSRAEQMARQAVIERLVPICVARFKEDPMRKQKLAQLQQADFVEQASFVEQQGWATIPGADGPIAEVANRCLREIRYTDVS